RGRRGRRRRSGRAIRLAPKTTGSCTGGEETRSDSHSPQQSDPGEPRSTSRDEHEAVRGGGVRRSTLKYPMVIGWLNGHTHQNQILAHRAGDHGFWEITTASCIDFPQQQQTVEIV